MSIIKKMFWITVIIICELMPVILTTALLLSIAFFRDGFR